MDKYEKTLREKLGQQLHYYDTVDSTNNVAKKMEEWTHGVLVVARTQTAGRGTYGRSFHSKAGQGIYMSLIIDLQQWAFKHEHLATHYTAVVTSEAIKEVTGIDIELKWVNDLFVNGKKIGGILTEKIFQSNKLIIGIGINLSGKVEDFPNALRNIATSLQLKPPVDEVAASLVIQIYKKVLASDHLSNVETLLKLYKEKLFICGQMVDIARGDEIFTARVVNVAANGGLVVECGEEYLTLQTGEVRLKL